MNNLVSLKYYNQQGGYIHKIRGIPNIGNYCFANSFFQSFYSSNKIRQEVLKFSDDKLPTNEEFFDIFKRNLHDNISRFIYPKIVNYQFSDGDKVYFTLENNPKLNDLSKLTFIIKNGINVNGNFSKHTDDYYKFESNELPVNLRKEQISIKIGYYDFFNLNQQITNAQLITKLSWFSNGSIIKSDLLEIMRFKYLKKLFTILNNSMNNVLEDNVNFRNVIKGIVATVVDEYNEGGGVNQSDSGEILLKLANVLEKIFVKDLLKMSDVNRFLVKNVTTNNISIKAYIKERTGNILVTLLNDAMECKRSECDLRELYNIYKDTEEYEAMTNTPLNIDLLSKQNDSNWGRNKLDDAIRETIKENEALLCVPDNSEQRTRSNPWTSNGLPKLPEPVHKCNTFIDKSQLQDMRYFCNDTSDIYIPISKHNTPQFLLFYFARANDDRTYNNAKIKYNLNETFFGNIYQLKGITCHSGQSAGGGHYTSIVKSEDNFYYYISDSYFSKISTDNVIKKEKLWVLLVYERKQNSLKEIIMNCN